MDIIALRGSPRKHANTDILLDEMIRGAEDNGHNVLKYHIIDLNVHPCCGCVYVCREKIVFLMKLYKIVHILWA